VSVSPAMQPMVCLRRTPFLPQPCLFPGSVTGLEYAGLHIPRLGYFGIGWN